MSSIVSDGARSPSSIEQDSMQSSPPTSTSMPPPAPRQGPPPPSNSASAASTAAPWVAATNPQPAGTTSGVLPKLVPNPPQIKELTPSPQAAAYQGVVTAAPWAKKPVGSTSNPTLTEPLGLGFVVASGLATSSSKGNATAATARMPVGDVVAAVPSSPAVIGVQAHHRRAEKKITSETELHRFLAGASAKSYMSFILSLGEAVMGKRLKDPCPENAVVSGLVQVLEEMEGWLDEIPPSQQSLRYGNPAYRIWAERLVKQAVPLMQRILPPDQQAAAPELASYFADSFGNATRIDYGTGHETTFAALLYCLARLGLVGEEDRQALVTRVFARYLRCVRKVATTYWLEPAGSHGVWGLDDHQFLAFAWGAAQLVGHQMIKPKSIHNAEVMEAYADDYLYLSSVRFVQQVKKGHLSETSPLLYDISGVATWAKVHSGLMKMYQVEVLSKVPIMQHFLFGALLPFE